MVSCFRANTSHSSREGIVAMPTISWEPPCQRKLNSSSPVCSLPTVNLNSNKILNVFNDMMFARLGLEKAKVFQMLLNVAGFSLPVVPKFPKEKLEPIEVDEGQPVVLRCDPPEGLPPRQIYWMSIGGYQCGDAAPSPGNGPDGHYGLLCSATGIPLRHCVVFDHVP